MPEITEHRDEMIMIALSCFDLQGLQLVSFITSLGSEISDLEKTVEVVEA